MVAGGQYLRNENLDANHTVVAFLIILLLSVGAAAKHGLIVIKRL
jgi:hypothetical protein